MTTVRKICTSAWAITAGFLLLSLLSPFSNAHDGVPHSASANSEEINSALHWLETSQREDGAIVVAGDVAGDYQATSEAVIVSALVGGEGINTAAAIAFLQDSPEALSTEQLARLVSALSDTSLPVAEAAHELGRRQGLDGGFGDFIGYDSTPLDTAYALIALQGIGQDAAVAGRALSYLSSAQLASGGFGYYGDQSSVMVSALVVKAIKPYLYTFNISSLLSRSVGFLYAVKGSGNLWDSDWESALALQALIPITTDTSLYELSVSALSGRQQGSGSWEGQVYSTALAMSTLDLLANLDVPADPEKAVIRGRLLDALTSNPLPNAAIDVRDVDSELVSIEADGAFAVSNLDAGNYIVSYSAPGYLGASQNLVLQKGQFADVGTIRLSVAPTASLITGTLIDSATGEPIAGATVTVTVNGSSVSAVSDENGHYQLLSELGAATLVVVSDSYYQVSASVELSAGTSISFSPELLPSSEEQPLSSSIRGVVVDADEQGLAEVLITLSGDAGSIRTGADGRFVVSELDAGEVQLVFSQEGYETLGASLIVPERTNVNVGVITMREQVILPSSSVSGQLLDLSTGLPVAGATVEAGLQSTTTDNSGFYQLSGISVLEFTIAVNAPGYLFTNKDISLSEHSDLALNINIRKADLGGVEVIGLASDAERYGAYQPVLITANLENNTALTVGARLYVKVTNSTGVEVAKFSASYLPPLDSALDEEELAHYQQHLAEAIEELAPSEQREIALEQWWNTENAPPGNYVLTVQAVDAATSNLVSEKSAVIEVIETTKLASLKAGASPGYVLLNGEADMVLTADILNRSNTETVLDFDYVFKDPQGQNLLSGHATVPLIADGLTSSIELGRVLHQFIASGNYVLEILNVSGADVEVLSNATVFVPPSIRLEIIQSLNPNEVVPLEGVSVKSNIQVKGVDGE